MRNGKLRRLVFLALCCDLGLCAKRLISPMTNAITGALHIPGGIGTSFSLMFLVVAAGLVPRFGCAALMGAVQSLLAISFGMVGSMGALSSIGYIVPGIVIDCVLLAARKTGRDGQGGALIANMLAAAAACLTANVIVFRLGGVALLLYLSVSLTTGAICGLLAGKLTVTLRPIIGAERKGKKP